jgi:hypothetical protein
MTRFYFDIHDGKQRYRDDDGDDLPDLSTAEATALRTALEMAREHLRTAKELKTTVQIRDHSEKPLVRVCVAAKVTVELLK